MKYLIITLLLISCSKPAVKQNDDMHRKANVSVSVQSGKWIVWINFDKPVASGVSGRVKWKCTHVVNYGLVYYDETFNIYGNQSIFFLTDKPAHESYTAEDVQVMKLTAEGYTIIF